MRDPRDGVPLPLDKWSATMWRKAEAARDRIMHGHGTEEDWIFESRPTIATWRKPLRLDEVNQMADTREARERPGRP